MGPWGSRGGSDYYVPLRPPRHFGLLIVPEKQAMVVERFGKFAKILGSGLHFLIPGVSRPPNFWPTIHVHICWRALLCCLLSPIAEAGP